MCDRYIFSANFLLTKLYTETRKQQHELYGNPINLNYFYIFIDTVLRMLSNFDRLYSLHKGDIVIVLDDVKCPKWQPMYTKYAGYTCTHEFIHKLAIAKLWKLNKYITDDDIDFYERIEAFLAKSYPQLFKFKLGIKSVHVHNPIEKEIVEKEIIELVSLIQSQLTQKSYKKVFETVLSYLQNLPKLTIVDYTPLAKGYEAAEIASMFDGKSKILAINNKKKQVDKVELKRRIFNSVELLSLYDFCRKEVCIILDINNVNMFNVFSNVRRTYKYNKISKKYLNENFHAELDSELEKESLVDMIAQLVKDFNTVYSFRIM